MGRAQGSWQPVGRRNRERLEARARSIPAWTRSSGALNLQRRKRRPGLSPAMIGTAAAACVMLAVAAVAWQAGWWGSPQPTAQVTPPKAAPAAPDPQIAVVIPARPPPADPRTAGRSRTRCGAAGSAPARRRPLARRRARSSRSVCPFRRPLTSKFRPPRGSRTGRSGQDLLPRMRDVPGDGGGACGKQSDRLAQR